MKSDIGKIVENIQRYFPRGKAPMPEWEDCKTSEDFVRKFGDEFFLGLWRYVYDDRAITKFLLPYAMEYFITLDTTDGSESDSADYFILRLDPVAQRETQTDWYVERLFDDLNEEQRRVICEWLRAMFERDEALVCVDGSITYWCGGKGE